MTTSEGFEKKLLELIAEVSVVKADKIRPHHRLREDLGMDSVGSMELVSMLSEQLGLDVSIEEAARITTVQGAIDLARSHLAAQAR